MKEYFKKSQRFVALVLTVLVAFTMMPVNSFAATGNKAVASDSSDKDNAQATRKITWAGSIKATADGGAVTSTLKATLAGDTFTAKGKALATSAYTVSKKPAGLTVSIAVDKTGKIATVKLSGTASASARKDITNFGITFKDTAFTGKKASTVSGYSKLTNAITFVGVSKLTIPTPTTAIVAGAKKAVTVEGFNMSSTVSVKLYDAAGKVVSTTGATIAKASGATTKKMVYNITTKSTLKAGTYTVKAFVGTSAKQTATFKVAAPAPATYTVTYDKNGATGSVTDTTKYKKDATVTVKAHTGLTFADHTFAGWNTKADGKGTSYAANGTFKMGSANVKLYAIWDKNAPVKTPITAVAISKTAPKVSDELTAIMTPATATATYSWKVGEEVKGSTATYTVDALDATKTITVTVTGTGEFTGTVTSAATSPVEAVIVDVPVTGVTLAPAAIEFANGDVATVARKVIEASIAPTTATNQKVKWTITGTDAAKFVLYNAETAGTVVALGTETDVTKVYVAPVEALTANMVATVTATSVSTDTVSGKTEISIKKEKSAAPVSAVLSGADEAANKTLTVTLAAAPVVGDVINVYATDAATTIDQVFTVVAANTTVTQVITLTTAAKENVYVSLISTGKSEGDRVVSTGYAPFIQAKVEVAKITTEKLGTITVGDTQTVLAKAQALVATGYTVSIKTVSDETKLTKLGVPVTAGSVDVIFTVTNDVTATDKADSLTAVVVTVTAAEELTSITTPIAQLVPNGTKLVDITTALGTTIPIITNSGLTKTAPIVWAADTLPSYKAETAGTYVLSGTVTLPKGVINRTGLPLTISINIVLADQLATIDSVNVVNATNVAVTLSKTAALTNADFTVERALKATPTAFTAVTLVTGNVVGGTGNLVYTITIPTIANGDVIRVTAKGTNLAASTGMGTYTSAFAVTSVDLVKSNMISVTLTTALENSLTAADINKFTVKLVQTKPSKTDVVAPITSVEGISGGRTVNLYTSLVAKEGTDVFVNGMTTAGTGFDFRTPTITGASTTRTSDTTAVLTLTSDESGIYKILVDPTGVAAEPTTEAALTGFGGNLAGTVAQDIQITGLTPGVAAKIYMMFIDSKATPNKSTVVSYTVNAVTQAATASRGIGAGTKFGTIITTGTAIKPAYVVISNTQPTTPLADSAMPTSGGTTLGATEQLADTNAVVGQWVSIYEAKGTSVLDAVKVGAFYKVQLTSTAHFKEVTQPAIAISQQVKQGATISGAAAAVVTGTDLTGFKLYANKGAFNLATAVEVTYAATATIATLPANMPEGTYSLYLYHVASGTSSIASATTFIVDNTAPVLTQGKVSRTADDQATIVYTSNETITAGVFAKLATTASLLADISTDVTGKSITADTDTTVTFDAGGATDELTTVGTLAAGNMVLSIIAKDKAGNVSNKLDITLPAYLQEVTTQSDVYTVVASESSNSAVSGANTIKLLTDGKISFKAGDKAALKAVSGSANFANISAVLGKLTAGDTVKIGTNGEITEVDFHAARTAPTVVQLGSNIANTATIVSSGAHTAGLTISGSTSGAITVSAFGALGAVDVSDNNLTGEVTVAGTTSGSIFAGTKKLILKNTAATKIYSAGSLSIAAEAVGANEIPASTSVTLTRNSSIAANGVLTVNGTLNLEGSCIFNNGGKLSNKANLNIKNGGTLKTAALDFDVAATVAPTAPSLANGNGELLSDVPYNTTTKTGGTLVYEGGKLIVNNVEMVGSSSINPVGAGSYVVVRTRGDGGSWLRTEGNITLMQDFALAAKSATTIADLSIRGDSVFTVTAGVTLTTVATTSITIDGILSIANGGALVNGNGTFELSTTVNAVQKTLRLAQGAKVTTGAARLFDGATGITTVGPLTVLPSSAVATKTTITAGDYVADTQMVTRTFTKTR